MTTLTVVDLFYGTGSSTRAFADRGHDVYGVELDERFDADLHADILDLTPSDLRPPFVGAPIDFLWASTPCTSYSVGSFRHHWDATTTCETCDGELRRVTGERWDHTARYSAFMCARPRPRKPLTYTPKSETGRLGHELLQHTLRLIAELRPTYWVIENPRALMRRMPELADIERRTITHCQYGDPRRMKPTDLFGVFPPGFDARACTNGSPCHEAAPRGAKTGTQGLNKTEAAMLPYALSLELCIATEEAIDRRLAA